MSSAMIGSSSMIRTSVATCSAISWPAVWTRQQERLPRPWRQRLEIALRSRVIERRGRAGIGRVEAHRGPQLQEGPIQPDTGIEIARKGCGIEDQRLQHGNDISVAAVLGAGQCAREPPQIGQMRRNFLGNRHGYVLFKRAGNEHLARPHDKRFIFWKLRNLLRRTLLNGSISVGIAHRVASGLDE
jgi:hypothetical protein